MATIVILGAGELGAALARQLAAVDVASRIVLVDDSDNVARGKALDIRQAAPVEGFTTAVDGSPSLDEVIAARFVVLADRSSTGAEWQEDAAVGLLGKVVALNRTASIVCAGSAQLTAIERAVRELGVDRRRMLGTAPEALRAAVTALTALEAGCAATDISLTVLGRPRDHIIVPWEDASIAGRRATAVLSPPALARLDTRLARLWPPGPFALASAATAAIRSAVTRSSRSVCAFVAMTREEGAFGRVGMLPVTLAGGGIAAINWPTLSRRDQVRLETALG